MKTVITIPKEILWRAERFARRRGMTRSALFTVAVNEYMKHHRAEDVTRTLNEVYGKEDSAVDPVLGHLQILVLPSKDWT